MKILKSKISVLSPEVRNIENSMLKCHRYALQRCVLSLKQIYSGDTESISSMHKFDKMLKRVKPDRSSLESFMKDMCSNVSLRLIIRDYFVDQCTKERAKECYKLWIPEFFGIRDKVESLLYTKYKSMILDTKVKFDTKTNSLESTITLDDSCYTLDEDKYNRFLYSLFCTKSKIDSYEESMSVLLFVLQEFKVSQRLTSDLNKVDSVRDLYKSLGSWALTDVPKTVSAKEVLRSYPLIRDALEEDQLDFILKYGKRRIANLIQYILEKGSTVY